MIGCLTTTVSEIEVLLVMSAAFFQYPSFSLVMLLKLSTLTQFGFRNSGIFSVLVDIIYSPVHLIAYSKIFSLSNLKQK